MKLTVTIPDDLADDELRINCQRNRGDWTGNGSVFVGGLRGKVFSAKVEVVDAPSAKKTPTRKKRSSKK
jgi:hypothetical protein